MSVIYLLSALYLSSFLFASAVPRALRLKTQTENGPIPDKIKATYQLMTTNPEIKILGFTTALNLINDFSW